MCGFFETETVGRVNTIATSQQNMIDNSTNYLIIQYSDYECFCECNMKQWYYETKHNNSNNTNPKQFAAKSGKFKRRDPGEKGRVSHVKTSNKH